MVVVWLSVAAAVLASISGCGGCDNDTRCPNGLGISVTTATGKPFADGRYTVDATLDGTAVRSECTITTAAMTCTNPSVVVKRDAAGSLVISMPEATPKHVDLTLSFEGVVIGKTSYDPEYFQYQPNGESCTPTCYVASHGMKTS